MKDEAVEALIRDDFKEPTVISIQEIIKILMEKARAHGGRFPDYMTGSWSQCRRWEDDVMAWAQKMDRPVAKPMTITGVRVFERPGPVRIIWTESV